MQRGWLEHFDFNSTDKSAVACDCPPGELILSTMALVFGLSAALRIAIVVFPQPPNKPIKPEEIMVRVLFTHKQHRCHARTVWTSQPMLDQSTHVGPVNP